MNIWLILFLVLIGFSIFINVLGFVMEKVYKRRINKKFEENK